MALYRISDNDMDRIIDALVTEINYCCDMAVEEANRPDWREHYNALAEDVQRLHDKLLAQRDNNTLEADLIAQISEILKGGEENATE